MSTCGRRSATVGLMSPRPAASYHHGNLREALIEAAIDVARERGPDGLALRDLARRVGVSHNAAYRHFADRDALVDEVAGRGLLALTGAMQARLAVADRVADPVLRARRRMGAAGHGYVDFALAEPGLFRVLFTAYPTAPDRAGAGGAGGAGQDPFELLNACLDDLVAVGFLAPAARLHAEITCWSTVHGFAVLHVEGPMRTASPLDREAALVATLTAIDRGYAASTGAVVTTGELFGDQ